MMPPLTDLIERLSCPDHPKHDILGRRLTRDERRELRHFCRDGLAELGLRLKPGMHIDSLIMTAVIIRAIIRFGCEDKVGQQNLRMLTVSFHPDPQARKAAAEEMGFLWDEGKQEPIIDYHFGGRDVGNLTARVLAGRGFVYGRA